MPADLLGGINFRVRGGHSVQMPVDLERIGRTPGRGEIRIRIGWEMVHFGSSYVAQINGADGCTVLLVALDKLSPGLFTRKTQPAGQGGNAGRVFRQAVSLTVVHHLQEMFNST